MYNRKVYFIAFFLILLAVCLVAVKVFYGGHTIAQEASRHLWRISIVMNITGKGARAKVRLTLPKDNERQTIYNEHFENNEMLFYIRERELTGNRVGFWRSELLDGVRSIQYTFSASLAHAAYPIPADLLIPDKPYEFYPQEFFTWLDPSRFIQSQDRRIGRHLKKAIGREKKVGGVVRKLYEFVRGEVKYRSEKGSKDAKETLKLLVADCGGQARLFAALNRAAGIPSRLVGGLIMSGGVKNTTHVWVENYIGGKWIPFDVVNGHFASIPAHYLGLYRGDYALVKHVGLEKFEYFFVIGDENIPPLDNPWSLYVLPLYFQNLVKILLLIPVGALVVAVFRTVIGIPTFGTFTPIILALAFREVSLTTGLLSLGLLVFLGWLFRRLLDHLKILVIPRLSIILTLVVTAVLVIMVVSFHFGRQQMLYVSLFPMVIMTWMIERFSVLEIEDGTKVALKTALGTAVVASVTYFIVGLRVVRTYLYIFPEILFVIMALLLLLGRYTGIRLTEYLRFHELKKVKV